MFNYHVYPPDDLVDHDTETENCICGPEINPVEQEDGSIVYVLVHHSLDGREMVEEQNAQ